jgi:hypothetical protein
VTSDEIKAAPVAPERPIWRVGLEVPVPERTVPEIRPGPVEWEPYRGIQFSTRVRVAISIAISIIPVFLVLAAGIQIFLGEGRVRAAFVFFLMPVVVIGPLAWWMLRDLWGRHR